MGEIVNGGPQLERFLEAYRVERRRLHKERPELYSDRPMTIRGNLGAVVTLHAPRSEEGIEQFCAAIRHGTFSKEGEAVKATCRRLHIPCTYKAIREFCAREPR